MKNTVLDTGDRSKALKSLGEWEKENLEGASKKKEEKKKKRKQDKTSPQVADKVQVCITNNNNTTVPSSLFPEGRYHRMDIFWNHTFRMQHKYMMSKYPSLKKPS